jgi:hypothetical protein
MVWFDIVGSRKGVFRFDDLGRFPPKWTWATWGRNTVRSDVDLRRPNGGATRDAVVDKDGGTKFANAADVHPAG